MLLRSTTRQRYGPALIGVVERYAPSLQWFPSSYVRPRQGIEGWIMDAKLVIIMHSLYSYCLLIITSSIAAPSRFLHQIKRGRCRWVLCADGSLPLLSVSSTPVSLPAPSLPFSTQQQRRTYVLPRLGTGPDRTPHMRSTRRPPGRCLDSGRRSRRPTGRAQGRAPAGGPPTSVKSLLAR